MAKMTLIIRPQPDADRDVALLMRYGVPALASPSMKRTHRTHELPESVNFSGIIMTSRNAVEAITKFDKVNADTGRWAKLPVFVVGPATAAAARDAGFSNIIRGTGGGAGLLAPISRYFTEKIGKQENGKSFNTNLPLLWPSAVEISFDLVAALSTHGVAVQRLPVYQMIASAGLDSTITDKITEGAIAAVVAMSVRSVQIFRRNLDAAGKASSLAGNGVNCWKFCYCGGRWRWLADRIYCAAATPESASSNCCFIAPAQQFKYVVRLSYLVARVFFE